MLTIRDIADALYGGGLRPGDSVMLHSSFKSLGGVEGGPDAVIDAFLDVLSPGGTLLVPTLIFKGSQHDFLHNYPPDVDLRQTPSRNGIISEQVRCRSGAVRSIHATSPAAGIGAKAAQVLGGHQLDDTCVGINSPWARNAAINGWVVLLGVAHNANTTLHHLEEQYAHWLLPPRHVTVTFVDTAGVRRTEKVRPYRPGLPRDYPKIEPILLNEALQRNLTIGTATVRLIRAAGLLERIGREMRKDPYYLLKDPASRPGPAE